MSVPLRELLRSLPVFAGIPDGAQDLADLPENPLQALEILLRRSIAAGEPEPHAMTLGTVSTDGVPSSRVLICKDVDEQSLFFASTASSRKGREIAAAPVASASFYWRGLGIQVRLVGTVTAAPRSVSEADWDARGRSSQVAGLLHQPAPPTSAGDVRAAAYELDQAHPGPLPAPPDWTVYALTPHEVELWQGRPDRLHTRVLHTRTHFGWTRFLLWP